MEKFRAKAANPALAERLTARAARAAERAIKTIEAERARAESAERERALEAEQKATTPVTPPANRDRSAGRLAHYMGHKNILNRV